MGQPESGLAEFAMKLASAESFPFHGHSGGVAIVYRYH